MVTVAQRLCLRMWLCAGRVFQGWLVWRCCWATKRWQYVHSGACHRWAEAPVKIARMTLTIKLDRNWSSFQLANSAPPLSVTDSAIAPSARMLWNVPFGCCSFGYARGVCLQVCGLQLRFVGRPAMVPRSVVCVCVFVCVCVSVVPVFLQCVGWGPEAPQKFRKSH